MWLAARGLDVVGCDVSPLAVDAACSAAAVLGLDEACRFVVADLDEGLPDGPPVDVVICQRFRDPRLDAALIERLVAGGVLAISALSQVGAQSTGRFHEPPGALVDAFGHLDVVASAEGDGVAWLVAKKP